MFLRELTNGLPQAFLSSNSRDTLSCRLSSIFRAIFQANSQKRASSRERPMIVIGQTLKILALHFNFSRNWILNALFFFRLQKQASRPITDELWTFECHVNIIFLITQLDHITQHNCKINKNINVISRFCRSERKSYFPSASKILKYFSI